MTIKLVRRTFAVAAVTRGPSSTTPEVVISSEAVDRQGDVVVASGGDWSGWWRTGAPVLWAHRHDQLPVAKGTRLWVDGQAQTHATFRWLEGDEFAERVKNVYSQGLLAASIGFIPLASEPLGRGAGTRFLRWSGVEFSLTPTPANVDAVPVARALGLPTEGQFLALDDELEEVLDVTGFTPAELARLERGRHLRQFDPYEPVRTLGPEDVRHAVASAVDLAVRRLRGRVD